VNKLVRASGHVAVLLYHHDDALELVEKKPSKRKVQPIVWDKGTGSQSQSQGGMV